jgi:hypothetical protein
VFLEGTNPKPFSDENRRHDSSVVCMSSSLVRFALANEESLKRSEVSNLDKARFLRKVPSKTLFYFFAYASRGVFFILFFNLIIVTFNVCLIITPVYFPLKVKK